MLISAGIPTHASTWIKRAIPSHSCIPIHTPTAAVPDANPACLWGGTRVGEEEWGEWRRGEQFGGEVRKRGGGEESRALFNLGRSVDRAESSASWIACSQLDSYSSRVPTSTCTACCSLSQNHNEKNIIFHNLLQFQPEVYKKYFLIRGNWFLCFMEIKPLLINIVKRASI